MLIEVKRDTLTPESTIGEMFLDGAFECYTLELPVKDGLPGSAIPPTGDSSYMVKLSPSSKFMHSTDLWVMRYANKIPHILGLPATRSNILIHWGNDASDTEGCLLVGETREVNMVGRSRLAFEKMWDKLMAAELRGETIQLKVYGGTLSNNRDSVREAAEAG